VAVWDDLEAIEADESLTPEAKRHARYTAKCSALADILAPFIGQTYRFEGVDYTLFVAAHEVRNGVPVLRIVALAKRVTDGAVLISPQDDLVFVNPPTLSKTRSKDLIAAAREMLQSLIGGEE
jgi:hypothetical protein